MTKEYIKRKTALQDARVKANEGFKKRIETEGLPTKGFVRFASVVEDLNITGTAGLNQHSDGVDMLVRLAGPLDEGRYGLLIHLGRDCRAKGQRVGKIIPAGEYQQYLDGDPGNIQINSAGSGIFYAKIMGASINQAATSVVGLAVVLHEFEYRYDGTGYSAGEPLACGIIRPSW